MINVRYDITDCKSAANLEYVPQQGLRAPYNWARVQWVNEIQPEKTPPQKAMEKLKRLAPDGDGKRVAELLSLQLEGTEQTMAEMTAFICPQCLEKLQVAQFDVRRTTRGADLGGI